MKIGVLAFQGDVIEHLEATKKAAANLSINIELAEVRTKKDLKGCKGLIIPGGESTVMHKLCEREGMFQEMKKIAAIFGTCAGAIMLAKKIEHADKDQKILELMDIQIDRNAYGRQADSFEEEIETTLGRMNAIFIRAPRIKQVGSNVRILADRKGEIIACEEETQSQYLLACCFHPEMTSSKFHEHFLKKAAERE
ncbi:pyridoxal 5'-phosphate synthase glutaminase subunit PdxT [Candidatus Micrarchaeota archaeon]|nr:pyridoxal 5'-phosphate synthase glutaminase subunit PdxT [Candidatus Micrarchaeota archaeon]